MILSDKEFLFQRKYFIKDLFEPKGLFAQFSSLEFKNFKAFINFIEAKLYTINKMEYIVNISTLEELAYLLKIVEETNLKKNNIVIRFPPELLSVVLEKIGDSPVQLSTYINSATVIDKDNLVFTNTTFWTEYTMTYKNYEQVYTDMISTILKYPFLNHIDFQVDYNSFESAPISELHKLHMIISLLRKWQYNKSSTDSSSNFLYLKSLPTVIKGVLDDEWNIFLDRNSPEVYFSIKDILNATGEDLSVVDLNLIRKLVDIKFPYTTNNWYLINLYQNQKIMNDIYEVPYLTKLILEWLY